MDDGGASVVEIEIGERGEVVDNGLPVQLLQSDTIAVERLSTLCDSESPSPWCCPWLSGESVVLMSCSEDPEEWGAQYWGEVKNEVRTIRAEEEIDRITYVEESALGELENELENQLYRFSSDELKKGRSAEAYFSVDGVSAYTRTDNSASYCDAQEDRNQLIGFLVDDALDRAVFVVGTESEARERFDCLYKALV